MRECRTCSKPIGAKNRSGLCSYCVARDPEAVERRRQGLLRTYAVRPEVRQAASARLRAVTCTPEHAERGRRLMKENRVWEHGIKACGPSGSPSRQKMAKSLSNTRLRHIPPELRDEYKRLVTVKDFSAAEATEIITSHHEMAMARWRRQIGAETKKAGPPIIPALLSGDIVEAVASIFGCSRSELRSDKKAPHLVDARCAITVLLKGEGKSYPYIGSLLNKDHTSALNLFRRYDQRATDNPLLREVVERLSERVAA